MPRPLDPRLVEILKRYEEDPKEAAWDCHGTWVVYHKAIERIAAKASITFDMPEIVEANSASKTAVIIARGFMGDRAEWSFGEASPSNNKNAYPFAMAEKRAKDRVVLKLVGLHGLAYSEEESDDFRADTVEKPKREVGFRGDGTRTSYALKNEGVWEEFERELAETTLVNIAKFAFAWSAKADADKWNKEFRDQAHEAINNRKRVLQQVENIQA